MTIKVDFPPELEAYVDDELKSGRFRSASDFVVEALQHRLCLKRIALRA